jgi:hypothetical protein
MFIDQISETCLKQSWKSFVTSDELIQRANLEIASSGAMIAQKIIKNNQQ